MAHEQIHLKCIFGIDADLKLNHIPTAGRDLITITDTIDGSMVVINDDEVDTLIAALLKLKTQFIYN